MTNNQSRTNGALLRCKADLSQCTGKFKATGTMLDNSKTTELNNNSLLSSNSQLPHNRTSTSRMLDTGVSLMTGRNKLPALWKKIHAAVFLDKFVPTFSDVS